MQQKYNLIGMGGTFDHFHDGHASFIDFAANLSHRLVIAVTDDSVKNSKQYPDQIQPHADRLQNVVEYCANQNIDAKVVPLHDVYGPTLQGSQVEAIAVTTATVQGAQQINAKRTELDLTPLPVHVHTLINDQTGQPITSTRIRAGQIDRQGTVYFELLKNGLQLQERHKKFFAQPQGEIINTASLSKPTCVVGDICLETFITNGWEYDLGAFDNKSMRTEYFSPTLSALKPECTVENDPGQISAQLAQTLANWSQQRNFKHLKINGEEDLATVCLVLVLPLGSSIYYGQPNQGIVELRVTEEKKHQFFTQLSNN